MITKINTNISEKTNKRIINLLYDVNTWRFGYDNNLSKNLDKTNAGLIYKSFTSKPGENFFPHDFLNTYATFIMDTVEQNCFLKFKKLRRIYWNWYSPGASMNMHQDDEADNTYSIIYNLHSNDGGTEFNYNNNCHFYKSNESEALLFPSKIHHRGVAPNKNLNRFALNILIEI